MSFDKKYYKEIKKFVDHQLSHVDFRLVEKYKDNPGEWAQTFLQQLRGCEHREDYEGAKAIKDAIVDFLNNFLPEGEKITDFDTLNLPEYKETKIEGAILCQDNYWRGK